MGMVKGQRENAAASSEAASHFAAGRYTSCSGVLQRMRDKASTDTKVLANLAIAEYLGSPQRRPHELLEKLSSIKTLAEEQAKTAASAEQQPASSPPSSPSEGAAGSQQLLQLEDAAAEATCMDALLLMNMAAVHLQLGEPSQASELLMPLYKQLEPLDERQALRVCLLLLDCWIMLGRNPDADRVMATISRATGLTETPKGPPPPPSEAGAVQGPPPDVQVTVRVARARMADLRGDLEAAGLELQAAAALDGSDPQVAAMTAQLQHRKGEDSLSAASLAAAIQHLRQPSDGGRGGGGRPALLGNLGRLHHRLGKHHTALLYYGRALRESLGEHPAGASSGGDGGSAEDGEGPVVQPLPEIQVAALRYGAGLQLLMTGQHLRASAMLRETMAVLYDSPLLWLRLAECCVQGHQQGGLGAGEEVRGAAKMGGEPGASAVILPVPRTRGERRAGEAEEGPAPLSMEMAERYLSNALFLLHSIEDASPSDSAPSQSQAVPASAPPGPSKQTMEQSAAGTSAPQPVKPPQVTRPQLAGPLKAAEREAARLAVLANLAYVALALGNPLAGLRHAKELLEASPPEEARYRVIGGCYAAEAHCMLGDPQAAAEQMRGSIAASAEVQGGEEGQGAAAGRSCDRTPAAIGGPEVRALLHVNLASVHAMRGDLSKARESVAKALKCDPGSRMAQMSSAYVSLLEGDAAGALKVIRWLQGAPGKPLAVL